MLAADRLLQRLAEVAQQMPAIQDVHRLGRPQPDGLAVDLGPVAGDDHNPRMAPQPSGDRFGLAIGQEIGDHPAFQIDDHRAVAVPGRQAHSSIAITRGGSATGADPDDAQNGGWAGRDGQTVGEPRGRRSA